MKFYNRKTELKLLNERINNDSFEFLVISGRRRVGKTELITKVTGMYLYFFVSRESPKSLLNTFTNQIKEYFDEEYIGFETFEEMIKYLVNKSKSQKITLIFDEFQNFKYVDESFFSILQKYVDIADRETIPIKIIVTGSYINMIKNIFDNSASPLYGRKTGELMITPLTYKYVKEILNDMGIADLKEIIKIYGVFGGIPRYYKLSSNIKYRNLNELLSKLIFTEISPIQSEVAEVFFEDILSIKKEYLSIIKAIALGNNTNKQISEFTGIEQTSLPHLLDELINHYEIIERNVPITANELKSKKGIYELKDYLLKFWFFFVEKNKAQYETRNYNYIIEKIKVEINDFIGKNSFERLAREYCQKKYLNYKVGSWWAGTEEIDVLGINENGGYIIGECKFTNKKVGFELYNLLIEKIQLLKPKKVEKIILFSKSGFQDNLIKKAEELNIELVNLEKLSDELSKC